MGGIGEPLESDNWEVVEPSALPTARAIRSSSKSTARAAEAGLDLLEVHAAHGYLLFSFLSPSSNRREDGYGETLEKLLRFPPEDFDAVRAWPADRHPLV